MSDSMFHRFLPVTIAALTAALTCLAQAQDAQPMITTRKILSNHGSTRATGYAMSNKIVRTENTLIVAWLDHVAIIRARSLDLTSGRWSDTVTVGQGVDNHSGPAMTMDSDGYLTIAYGPHHGPFQLRRSRDPGDVSHWGPVESVGVNGTYPSLVCGPDDTLYLTYRGGAMPRRLMFQKRPAQGSWSDPLELVNPDVPGGYTQFGNALTVGPDGTLHLVFHIYDSYPGGGKAAGYLRSHDGGESWETADGTAIPLPATPASPCFFAQGEALDMRVGNVAIGPQGQPFTITSQLKRRPVSATLWRYDGDTWIQRDLLEAVRKTWPDRAVGMHGTLTFDRNGRLTIALVTAADPGGGWGHPSWNVVALVSDDLGRTFTAFDISDPAPDQPCWLASLERPYNQEPLPGPPAMIYTQGGPGEGCTGGPGTTVHFVQIAPAETPIQP